MAMGIREKLKMKKQIVPTFLIIQNTKSLTENVERVSLTNVPTVGEFGIHCVGS